MIKKLEDPAYEKRLKHILTHPDLPEEVFAHVANGGTVLTLSEAWGVRYSDVMRFIRTHPEHDKRYIQALNDRGEWGREAFLAEIRRVGLVNVREAFNADGSLKPVTEIPDDIMRCVASIEVDELFSGAGAERMQIGVTKKIKLESKLKALELAMKNAGLLVDKVVHSVDKKLEDLLAESNKKEEPSPPGNGAQP